MEKWRNSKTNKAFKIHFSAKLRNFLCGYPTIQRGVLCILNIPTLHFRIHFFDFWKKVVYQMCSRRYTGNGLSVAEIKAQGGDDVVVKYKVQEQRCQNPSCEKVCKNFVFLRTHVMKRKQPDEVNSCYQFYQNTNALEELNERAKHETKILRNLAKKSRARKVF